MPQKRKTLAEIRQEVEIFEESLREKGMAENARSDERDKLVNAMLTRLEREKKRHNINVEIGKIMIALDNDYPPMAWEDHSDSSGPLYVGGSQRLYSISLFVHRNQDPDAVWKPNDGIVRADQTPRTKIRDLERYASIVFPF